MPTIDALAPPEHGPIRTCVGCRTRRPSVELVRVTRGAPGDGSADDGVHVEVDGPSRGRGAWLCRDSLDACLELALRRRGFDRAWRRRSGSDDADHITKALDGLTNTVAASDAADETPGGAAAAVVGMTTGKG